MRLLICRSILRRLISLLFCLVLIDCFGILFGQTVKQDIKFTNISIKDGLSQSSPNCIFQDSKGLMWIGTEDGLNKYDGYEFIIYRPVQDDPSSLSNPRILSVHEDLHGTLWIGTNGGGLNKYDRMSGKFSAFMPGSGSSISLAGKVVRCILPASDQDLWLGTENGLSLYNLKTGKFVNLKTRFPETVNLTGIAVNSLVMEQQELWIGTAEGMFCLDTTAKSLLHFVHDPLNELTIPGNNVISLLAENNGNMLIGTDEGMVQMDIRTRSITQPDFLNGSAVPKNIKALLKDSEGNLWIGTFGNGLYVWQAQTGKMINLSYDYNNPYSIKNNEVLSIFIDFSGIIWVGTNGVDLYNPKREKFILYDYVPYSNNKLVFRNIHPIYMDGSGLLWIGSKTDGLHMLNRAAKSYSRLLGDPNGSNGLSSSKIRAIQEYPEGVMWIGTEDQGINKVVLDVNRKPVRFKHYRHQPGNPNSITSNKVYAFYADQSGKLWIGTDNGLTVMDIETETFKQYLPDTTKPNGLNNGTVYGIFHDNTGNIWLATDYGINKYDPTTDGFVHFTHNPQNDNSVIHNEILCFQEDYQGNIWIGTYGKGLDRYDPVNNKFTHYTNIKLLTTAVIYGILEDNKRNLWMSTNNGIIEFDPETGDIKQFSIEDGLQSNEFNGTSYLRTNNGEMFFGGQYGLNSFFPQDVLIDSTPPKIVLSDLQVLNVSVMPGDDSPISSPITEAREIVLSHRQNNFTLYFSALHFANPAMNQYKYMLEGFDDDWIDAGSKRFVSYTNLPYRNYTFRVLASNSDGVWNTKGIDIKIKVKPPFWSTFWFRILAILIVLGAIAFMVKNRVTVAQRQKEILEEKFETSSKELEEARLKLDNQHAEIVIQKRELLQREKDQESLIWFNQGLGIFSDLISKNRENLTALCQEVIEKLVDYVDAQQGGVYLLDAELDNKKQLNLIAHYAFSESRINKNFEIGEGYVGSCFVDSEFVEVDNLTDNYSVLSSGLGKVSLKHLVLAPLRINEECIGVVEIGSFKKIKGYRISFIEKLMETFASTISTEQANMRLKKLIEQSTKQSKELAENEEQLRLNLEEIMATQEESTRREDELIKLAEESATREEMLSQEIESLKKKISDLTGQPLENQAN